jgi:hypothetical protein
MLSLDMSAFIDQAFEILNGFWPLIAALGALSVGFALVKGFPKFFKGLF